MSEKIPTSPTTGAEVGPAVDRVLAMCHVCGTVRTVSPKARRDRLTCATCRRPTRHATPFVDRHLDGQDGPSPAKRLRRVLRLAEVLRRIGFDVDLDADTPSSSPIAMGRDDGGLYIDVSRELTIRSKEVLLVEALRWVTMVDEMVWCWMSDETNRDPWSLTEGSSVLTAVMADTLAFQCELGKGL